MEAREAHETTLEKPPMRSEEEKDESMLSPGFRSAAAMAGWDEEALLLASLIVEDTPLRESRHRKRPGFLSKTPSSTNSIRKRKSKRRQSPASMPAVVLCLDDEEKDIQEGDAVKRREEGDGGVEEEKKGEEEVLANGVPCMDRLREELSCAICLEVCFEPSTTPCGHSFCMKCLKSSASKCGKRCPKCRQLISNTRSYTVNTVLWNTIQLLFPDEIKARTKCVNTASPKTSPERRIRNTITSNARTTISQASIARDNNNNNNNNNGSNRQRRAMPSQSEDAALALRLQREEFMEAFRENDSEQQQQPRNLSVYTARNNLRAMASRAVNFRRRGRFPFIID